MILAPLIGTCAFSADWPQYYGPSRDSTSTEKGLLRTWPNDGPKVLWTAPLGIGFGGPAVSAGKVYLLDRDDNVGDTLRVYDLSNGKELWTFAYAGPGKVEFPGSRSTPTVDGDLLNSGTSYVTPSLVKVGSEDQLVMIKKAPLRSRTAEFIVLIEPSLDQGPKREAITGKR